MRKAPKGGAWCPLDAAANRVNKRQFGHVKTRYRGLAKNRAHIFTLFALVNLFLMRRRLMASGGEG